MANKRILLRRDTRENWNNNNPVLYNGEIGVILEDPISGHSTIKIGDGITPWNNLPEFQRTEGSLYEALLNYYTKEEISGLLEKKGNISSEDLNEELDDVNTDTSVRYVSQVLTAEQKSQVMKNLGINSKNFSINFSSGEDTVSLALMDSNCLITKIKYKNIKNIYLSYGEVLKEELNLETFSPIDLGEADFLIITVTKETENLDAVLGITLSL